MMTTPLLTTTDPSLMLLALFLVLCGLVPVGLALHADARHARHPAALPRLAAAALVGPEGALGAARLAGYPLAATLTWHRGTWIIEAADAAGRPARVSVDAWTGRVMA